LLKLFQPTRDSEWVAILTNLPQTDAPASGCELYRNRCIETLFLTITEISMVRTLDHPKAALFSFSMALVAYNILPPYLRWSACMVGKVQAGLSDFYLVDEIQGIYRGMMIYQFHHLTGNHLGHFFEPDGTLTQHLQLRSILNAFSRQKSQPLVC